jgi:type IV pilus assembly protein PilX
VKQRSFQARTSGQRGVVLFVALIVLVVMALTGVAMIRQSGTGLSIAGNVGMRQNSLSGADLGTEAAMAWWVPLRNVPGALDLDLPAQGYFSDWGTSNAARLSGDPTQYPWDNANSVLVTADDGTGNEVRYIIERLCEDKDVSSTAAGQKCVQMPIKDGNDMSGTCDNYPKACPPPPMVVQYRVSSRSVGPRNTVSYIQVMLTSS